MKQIVIKPIDYNIKTTIINKIGGGIPNNKKFKAAQTGGPSGGCIPASLIDIPRVAASFRGKTP